jgi:hypothetical protein
MHAACTHTKWVITDTKSLSKVKGKVWNNFCYTDICMAWYITFWQVKPPHSPWETGTVNITKHYISNSKQSSFCFVCLLFPKTKWKSLQEHERVATKNLGTHAITGNVSTTSIKKIASRTHNNTVFPIKLYLHYLINFNNF